MSAIELCRTAELGGHVEGCRSCGAIRVAYNSCRNRHCPKCQGQACREWLAARQAELLPVPYFHVVFTLPAANRGDRLPEQGGGLHDPVQGGGGDATHVAADRRRFQASRRRDRPHRASCTAGVRTSTIIPISIASSRAAACRPTERAGSPAGPASSCRCACCRACSAGSSWRNCGQLRSGRAELLRQSRRPGRRRLPSPAGLAKSAASTGLSTPSRPFGGPEQVLAYLGRYTHRVAIANSRLVSMANGEVAFRWRDYRHGGKTKLMTLERMSSSVASCCTPCRTASTASAITASSPTAIAPQSSTCVAGCWPTRSRTDAA